MKIGIVSDFYFPWIGGPSAVIRNLGHGLTARGHRVCLLVPSPNGTASCEHDGPLEVQRAQTAPLPFGYNVRVSYRPRHDAALWLDRVRPDVLHFHHPFPLSVATASLARRQGIPVVATNHTIPECSLWGMRNAGVTYRFAHSAFTRWLLYVLTVADAVVTPTETAAHLLRKLGYDRQVFPISNGIDTSRFAPGAANAALLQRLGLAAKPTILYTGRLDAEKQMGVWLRTAAILAKDLDIQFAVGGKGTDEIPLRRLAGRLGLADRIRFIGYVPDDDLPDLYRLAHAYLITSTVELQSISTLEAAASGLPIVAVSAGALPELVRDGENGFLVPTGDHLLAADRLARIMGDAKLRSNFAIRSRQIAETHDLLRSVEEYERLLMSIVSERRGEPQVERVPAGHY